MTVILMMEMDAPLIAPWNQTTRVATIMEYTSASILPISPLASSIFLNQKHKIRELSSFPFHL
jgi:hypothetical protein